MKDVLRTIFAGSAAVGITGALSPIVTALSLVGEEAMDPLLVIWAESVLASAGVKTQCKGLENLPAGNFVLAINHQSHFDALVIFKHLKRHMRFVAKEELKRIPVFGYALQRAGNVFVNRKGTEADRAVMKDAVKAVRERVSVVFFAEGTRSEDGVLRPFKKGAAIMALEAQVPIVPAALAGCYKILPKGSLAIHPHPAAIVIGEPIFTEGRSVDDRDKLTEEAHSRVVKLFDDANRLVEDMKSGR